MPAAPMPPLELVQQAKKGLGVKGDRALWKAIGLDSGGVHSRMKHLRDGTGSLNYDETWRLLDAAGFMSLMCRPVALAERVVTQLDAGETFAPRPLEQLATSVERLAVDLHRLADRLKEGAQSARRLR